MNPEVVDQAQNEEPEVSSNSSSVDNIDVDNISFPGEENGDADANNSSDSSSADDNSSNGDDQDGNQEQQVNSDTQEESGDSGGDEGGDTSTNDESNQEGGTSDANSDNQSDEGSSNEEYDQAFTELSEETGIEVRSSDEVVQALQELAGYRKGEGVQSNLSPAIMAAIGVEKAGGDLSEHFRRVGMDFEKMDGAEVLRQKFFKDNASLHKQNPKLAQMKFERQSKDNYGMFHHYQSLKTEDEKEQYAEEVGMENIEYEKLSYENDVAQGKTDLQAWQKESAPKQETPPGSASNVSQEKIDAYQANAKEALKNFEAVTIPIGENVEDYALGLNESTTPIVTDWVENPYNFLQAIGFEGDSIDTERLLPIMTLIAEAAEGSLGSRLKEYIVSNKNIETIEKKVDNANNFEKQAPPPEKEGDVWSQIAEGAEEARKKRGLSN